MEEGAQAGCEEDGYVMQHPSSAPTLLGASGLPASGPPLAPRHREPQSPRAFIPPMERQLVRAWEGVLAPEPLAEAPCAGAPAKPTAPAPAGRDRPSLVAGEKVQNKRE